jgi:SnoaL-like polyketide cyclase
MRCTGYHRPLEKEAIMGTAGNKDLARRLYTLINEGRVDQVANLISPDYIEHDPLPGQGSGREGVLDRFSMITTALAPHFTVEDLITERDRIVVRWTNRAHMSANSPGSPPPVEHSPSPASTSTASLTNSCASTGM